MGFLLSSYGRRRDWYHKRKSFEEEVKLTWNWHSRKRTWGKNQVTCFEKEYTVQQYRVECQFFVCSSCVIMKEKFCSCYSSFLSTCIIQACPPYLLSTTLHLNAYPKWVVLVWCGLKYLMHDSLNCTRILKTSNNLMHVVPQVCDDWLISTSEFSCHGWNDCQLWISAFSYVCTISMTRIETRGGNYSLFVTP